LRLLRAAEKELTAKLQELGPDGYKTWTKALTANDVRDLYVRSWKNPLVPQRKRKKSAATQQEQQQQNVSTAVHQDPLMQAILSKLDAILHRQKDAHNHASKQRATLREMLSDDEPGRTDTVDITTGRPLVGKRNVAMAHLHDRLDETKRAYVKVKQEKLDAQDDTEIQRDTLQATSLTLDLWQGYADELKKQVEQLGGSPLNWTDFRNGSRV